MEAQAGSDLKVSFRETSFYGTRGTIEISEGKKNPIVLAIYNVCEVQ